VTTAGPPPVQRDTMRLVAFSDAVFAITITLLVLEIKPPGDYKNLLHDLLALWASYLAYAVTFLFIGQVWVNHHVMFDDIRTADRTVLLLNTLLLMVVAFLPFATSVLAGGVAQRGRAANRRGLLWHCFRPDGADVQRRLAVRIPSPADQRSARHCGRDRHRPAVSARIGVARGWCRHRRSAARPGRGRDRRIQRLLLAPDQR
jgi:hypothetical protein